MHYKRLKTKMKTVSIFIILLLFMPVLCAAEEGAAQNEETEGLIRRQYDMGGLDRIRDELENYVDDESMDLLGGYDADELMNDLLSGSAGIDLKGIGGNALRLVFKEFYQNMGILIKITVLVIICALLKNLQADFMSEGAGRIAFYVCYIVTVSILLVSFGTVIEMGTGIIDSMVGFMYATIPVLLALLISGGNITAGGIMHPVLLLIVETAATLIRNVFVPLVFMSNILMIVNNISDKIQLTRLVNLIKQIVSWALGIILTVFIIAVTLQGSLGAVIDGATQKAAKFAISTFIPIVGKTLADAADTVIGCTLLIKNAAGAAAMIGILLICVVPLLKIIAMVGLFKAASALLEPISETRITNCINDVAGSMLYIFALTAAVAFMFLISVTALISAGNLSAMLR
ncbi:MAG: stage III sporulation protein AE [Clostridiaceae bacterium]|jgi:stage III sporulation protein AE|nr:stage III sporulation protein AE [Clostridiaceae bacterium]